MSELEKSREKVDALYRKLNLVTLKIAVETDAGVLETLQEESLRLQAELRSAEALRREEINSSQNARAVNTRRDERMGEGTTRLEAKVELRMPNVPTSIVHLLARGKTPLLTVTVTNTDKVTRRVKVTSYIEGFSARAVTTREIPKKSAESFNQFPAFFPDRVATVNEFTTAALHVEVEDLDGKIELHESYPIPLLARTTGLLSTYDPMTGKDVDLTDLCAAWVTPNAPEVFDILRKGADRISFKAMLGYQTDAAGVREHVRAVFDVLKDLGIVYVDSPVAFGNHQGQFIQRIRLPRESIKARSANCIDGAVLMASLLEATGIEPAIVFVPGHAYLAWRPERPDPGVPDKWEYLETTQIGKGSFDDACRIAAQRTSMQIKVMNAHPEMTFVKILSIAKMRAAGITPME